MLATGSELVEADATPGPGQIRNSNGPMLVAQATRSGAVPRYLGIGRDDANVLAAMVRDGLENSDVLILAGGVSVGAFDLVPGVLRDLGVEAHFHKVRMKPGKPLLFGTRGSTLVFGLPGNPVSSFVCFELFVRPALRAARRPPRPRADDGEVAVERSHLPRRTTGRRSIPLSWKGRRCGRCRGSGRRTCGHC